MGAEAGRGCWLPVGDDVVGAGPESDDVREVEGRHEDGFRMPCGEPDACSGGDDGVVVALLSLEGQRGQDGGGGGGGGRREVEFERE